MPARRPTASAAGSGTAPLSFATPAGWRAWLRRNHGRPEGAWVLIAKKGTGRGLLHAAALEEALCWGWIDGRLHTHDGQYFALWFSPRRPRSIWSLANRRTAERLTREGRMQPAGLARIREAKASGRWEAAYAAERSPPLAAEVRRALSRAGALAAFRGLSPSRRLQLLSWIAEARRPETRARRLAALPVLALPAGAPLSLPPRGSPRS